MRGGKKVIQVMCSLLKFNRPTINLPGASLKQQTLFLFDFKKVNSILKQGNMLGYLIRIYWSNQDLSFSSSINSKKPDSTVLFRGCLV